MTSPPPPQRPVRSADPGFIEPSDAVPLRYGTTRVRRIVAIALLIGGGVVLQFGSVYTLGLLGAGLAASVAGWCVVPSTGWRRTVSVVPGVLGVAALLNGAASGLLLALTLAAWLLVRMRPLRSYVVIALPVAGALTLGAVFPQYGEGVEVGIALGLVLVGSAWLGRSLAAWRPRPFAGFFQRRQRDRTLN